jgi:RNA polymerase sigma-70 factor, ECF subfamily
MTLGEREMDAPRDLGIEDIELAEFARAHYPRLVRLAALVCRDANDAEDAVQAALERAWRRRADRTGRDRLRSWLDRIVVREAIRVSTRLVRFPRLTRPARQIVAAVEPPISADWAALRIAFDDLSPEQRAVVSLHLYAGYSVPECAALLDVPVETVRSRLRLARARLRRELGESRT